MITDLQVSRALDAVERHEARLLAWGILDGAMSEDEILDLIGEHVGGDEVELFAELRRRLLVFEVPRSSPPQFRSRMAEGVRLFATLRQQFDTRPWQDAARLVADYRFLVRPRRFPRRVFDADDVIEQLGGAGLPGPATTTIRGLLEGEQRRRLSRFQVDATREVLRGLEADRDRAAIVTAGTGAGKTLAFYLPALIHLTSPERQERGTCVLALYPRNELLKDQLLATLREVRRLRSRAPGLRRVRIGAYFGLTPLDASDPDPSRGGWRRWGGGLLCPFLVCPADVDGAPCGGNLVWPDGDRAGGRERLVCAACGAAVESDELVVTRRSMQEEPPQIVFTTTEMLNRAMSDGWSRHVFGIGPRAPRGPRLMLIDEAHTYSGPSGAQAAYVLRRWRHLTKGPVTWVGLSATLRDAEQYFARLTGVPADFVREVAPLREDLEQRGQEYQLILRGDPASQTALLSTSIQTAMLLLRIQDPLGTAPSRGAYGHKLFAFCDNLDLTNRLFRQLLDAEGRDPVGRPDPQRSGSLALLRSTDHHPGGSTITDWAERDRNGQAWWMVDELRADARPPAIGRTSSQDAGVAGDAETVVATASLEVGYDDPAVGAVLQHKAPRDAAQFLQRRGRAGRSQMMRPWTVVVLSDYGRDRLAYQAYEQLFDPSLPPKSLPLGNRAILRMQATFAMIDWVATRLAEGRSRDVVRHYFAEPQGDAKKRHRQEAAARILRSVLEDESALQELTSFVRRSLKLTSEETEVVLWGGPRSVLLEAVPTALRRLESSWHAVVDGEPVAKGDRRRRDHPLPEFVPANLFSDLCLPEVRLVPPEGYDASADTEEPVFLMLNQLAPGNVTLRYAVWKTRGLWIDPGDGGRLDITGSLAHDADVIAQIDGSEGEPIDVLRPYTISAEIPPSEVASTSRGRLTWRSRFSPAHAAIDASAPTVGAWRDAIDATAFYLQAGRGGVQILRYARGGTADVKRARGGVETRAYEFACGSRPVAVGVELEVDAARFRLRTASDLAEFDLDGDPRRLRQLRRDRYIDVVRRGLAGQEAVNPFLASWLAEIAATAAARRAVGDGPDDGPTAWSPIAWRENLVAAFDEVFQGLRDGDVGDDGLPLRSAVERAIDVEGVRAVLASAWADLRDDRRDDWLPWLNRRVATTAAGAIHAAIQMLLPDFDADVDLVIDTEPAPDGHVDIWVSDVAVGGGGLVEAFHAAYSEDPRRFWHLALGALEAQDLELTAGLLPRVLAELGHEPLARRVKAYRDARSGDDAIETWQEALRHLATTGIQATHSLAVSVSTRLTRPGSNAATDSVIRAALERWSTIEEDLGYALDQRTACALLAADPDIADGLRAAVGASEADADRAWVFAALLNVLWTPPDALRGHALAPPMTFTQDQPLTERTLLLELLTDPAALIDVGESDWRDRADAGLTENGRCVLSVPAGREHDLQRAVHELMARPTEMGSLYLHPRIVGIRSRDGRVEAIAELAEAPQ